MYRRPIVVTYLKPEVCAWLDTVAQTTINSREEVAAEIITRAYAAAQEVES